jgi:GT2 family glycosyltransferase
VIIPVASTTELLGSCLASLARSGPSRIEYETIVVLNDAAPHVEAGLRETVTGIEVVASPINLGMAGAGNLGRAHARGEFLVTLHDDAEIEAGWLEALVETAEAHPEAGAIGGKVLYPDGRLQNAGMILWRDATTSTALAPGAPLPATFDQLRAVDYCGTSSLLVRTAAWDAVGGLDERFFPAYYIDVDLGMALRQRNWVVLYQPRSCIRHHQGASTSWRLRSFLMARNRQRFVEKWAAALEAHDAPDKSSLAGVERAMARAEAFAARCRERRGVEATQPVAALDTFAPELQQRRHLAEWRELNKAYAAYLTGLLEAAETDRDRWRDACAAQEDACVAQEKELAVHRARSRTFAALERIWRQTYWRLSGLFDRLHLT